MSRNGEDCCFDRWAANDAKRVRRRRVRGIASDLVDSVEGSGLRGRSVLDLGCGVGGVAIETVLRGASRATGLDLSSKAIEEAEALSRDSGSRDRTRFLVGDAATDELEQHDIVLLNRVFCCYADVDGLLRNSTSAARWVYAFTVPPSGGARGILARAVVSLSNAWYRLRESRFHGFRAYVHDVSRIEAGVRAAGFDLTTSGRRAAWDLRVYTRPSEGRGA